MKVAKRLFSRKHGPKLSMHDTMRKQAAAKEDKTPGLFDLMQTPDTIAYVNRRSKELWQNNEDALFRQRAAVSTLNGVLQREFKYEFETYKVDQRVANIICDMGFVLTEESGSRFQRMVKTTPKHLIIVTYPLRKRLVCPPDPNSDQENMLKKLKGHTFGDYLKKHGLMPANMQGKEYDEETLVKEEIERNKNPLEEVYDDRDDEITFEIAIVNKRNQAVVISSFVKESNLTIGQIKVVTGGQGMEFARKTAIERKLELFSRFQSRYDGPIFSQLSETLQSRTTEYLYEVGVHPEIALAVEYMSWNKDQRLYMGWLRDLYQHLKPDSDSLIS